MHGYGAYFKLLLKGTKKGQRNKRQEEKNPSSERKGWTMKMAGRNFLLLWPSFMSASSNSSFMRNLHSRDFT